MMQLTKRTVVLLAAAALTFAFGIGHLFVLRYRAGDIYPVYSSLRADPLGAKAFYESLHRCGRVRVTRNYDQVTGMALDPDTALLWLGDTIRRGERIDGDTIGTLNSFVRRGGRLVFVFLPTNRRKPKPPKEPEQADDPEEDEQTEETEDKDGKTDKTEPKANKADKAPPPTCGGGAWGHGSWPTAVETWLGTGIEHEYIDRSQRDPENPWPEATPAAGAAGAGLPKRVSCHTSLYFIEPQPEKCKACRAAACSDDPEAEVDPEECTCAASAEKNEYPWRIVYTRGDKPVVIERSIGKGTIVLSALSYFVSNEAMRKERHTELLLWLTGGRKNVVFDESHHGIMKQRGVASLLRKYRLHWLGAGLLLLAGLFVWKSSAGLVPPDDNAPGSVAAPVAEGKDSAAGLTNLLRRNLKRRDMLGICLNEYRTSLGRIDNRTQRKLDRIVALVEEEKARPVRQRDNTKVYNEICKTVNER